MFSFVSFAPRETFSVTKICSFHFNSVFFLLFAHVFNRSMHVGRLFLLYKMSLFYENNFRFTKYTQPKICIYIKLNDWIIKLLRLFYLKNNQLDEWNMRE